jgi:hypothetical protein
MLPIAAFGARADTTGSCQHTFPPRYCQVANADIAEFTQLGEIPEEHFDKTSSST